jgi:hypothetical protein
MDVSDDVLGLILERVGSHIALIRAAAVCRRWRRAVADADFLRGFRSLHAPAVAGEYHNGSIWPNFLTGTGETRIKGPVFLPSSPSMVDASHFSLDFLPNGAGCWNIVDSRGSLLLMAGADVKRINNIREMLVCEPLTRSYMMVTPMPDFHGSCLQSFLIDGITDKAGGCIGMSNFRVLRILYGNQRSYAAVFTKGGESGSTSWSEKSIDCIATMSRVLLTLGHAGGSWYFYIDDRILIILDGSTGEFSRSQLPVAVYQDVGMLTYNFYIMEGRDGKPRLFTAFGDSIKVFMRLGSGDWVLEKRILLSEATSSLPGYHPSFFSHPPSILTRGVGFIILSPTSQRWPISVDLETMEASPAAGDMGPMVYRCELPWPPALHTLQWYRHASDLRILISRSMTFFYVFILHLHEDYRCRVKAFVMAS